MQIHAEKNEPKQMYSKTTVQEMLKVSTHQERGIKKQAESEGN